MFDPKRGRLCFRLWVKCDHSFFLSLWFTQHVRQVIRSMPGMIAKQILSLNVVVLSDEDDQEVEKGGSRGVQGRKPLAGPDCFSGSIGVAIRFHRGGNPVPSGWQSGSLGTNALATPCHSAISTLDILFGTSILVRFDFEIG